MIIANLILAVLFLLVLIKCAGYSIKYSSRIARILCFPEFIVSFFIVALISVLPEATISIISAINGEPELGLGTLLGSNIADLTLVFGIVALFSSKGIKVESKILQNNLLYVLLLLFPIILGFDGSFSRIDGVILVLAGGSFFVRIYFEGKMKCRISSKRKEKHLFRNLFLLILSLGILLASAFYTVKFATNFANDINIPSVLIGISVLALGTCLPELVFSIKAIMKNHDELALGDILGTVVTDATIVLGIVALISPFAYNLNNLYITGTAMVFAGILVTHFMRTGKILAKREGIALLFFYALYLLIEVLINIS